MMKSLKLHASYKIVFKIVLKIIVFVYCFRVFFKSGLLFCPHCGNKSMIKVLADTSNDGITRYTPLSDKQFSHKGLRVSLIIIIILLMFSS